MSTNLISQHAIKAFVKKNSFGFDLIEVFKCVCSSTKMATKPNITIGNMK